MKTTAAILLMILCSCNALPELYRSVEDIANDDAIDIMISREAISKKKDINISIDLTNSQAK